MTQQVAAPRITPTDLPTLDSVVHRRVPGPWWTRNGNALYLLFAQGIDAVHSGLLGQPKNELERAGRDIRGLRIFCLRDLRPGAKGGDQFHRLRTEFSFTTDGVFIFRCEDVVGNVKEYLIDRDSTIAIPPFVRHSYEVQSAGTLITLANTIFEMEDPQTYDTFTAQDFEQLKNDYANGRLS